MANLKSNTKLSRYSFMKASEVTDSFSGEAYPDILSADYTTFEFTVTPKKIYLDPSQVEKPFYISKKYYDTYTGDDILLDLNLIPHYKYLEIGAPFYIPDVGDFKTFVKKATSVAKSQRKL